MTKPLRGRHIVLTAGPTVEPIDPVRFISNRSSGKQGYALAEALAALGAKITLVSGPTALKDPKGVGIIRVETALEMLAAVEQALPADVFIAVAAVADWRPAERAQVKLKLDKSSYSSLPLVENPDILKTVSQLQTGRPALVIGFAAETHDVERLATEKRIRKGCDWIIANDVSGDVMGGDKNAIHLIMNDSIDTWPLASKAIIAQRLAQKIADFHS
jgi:phosphopantothenoylcysteine decarboxylase/phosphopantothenate--cysteine ligase